MPKVVDRGLSLPLRGLLFCVFFLSGFSSLVLETAWSKQLSYLLGVDLFGAASAVVAYMSGLGLGAFLAAKYAARTFARPLRSYALLQALIGVAGVVSIPVLLSTTPLFSVVYQLNHNQVLFFGLRFAVTLALLLPVTTLMGMTLPVVISAHGGAGARTAGLLYGLNTLGAVAGALCAGFSFIPAWGLFRTCVFAGGVDLLLAFVVWITLVRVETRRTATPQLDEPLPDSAWPRGARPVVLTVALSGVCALGLELAWFRLLVQVVGPSVNAFSITLAVFLAGIGLGSALLSASMRYLPSGRAALVVSLVWTAVGASVPAYFLNEIPGWYLELWNEWGAQGRAIDLMRSQATIAALIILPATLGLGAAFPAALWACEEATGATVDGLKSAVLAGRLYFANTVGAVLGTLVWAFLVLPRLGAGGGIKMAAACAILAIAVVLTTADGSTRRFLPWAYALIVGLGAMLWLVPPVDPLIQNSGLFSAVRGPRAKGKVDVKPLRKEASLLFAKEGYNATVAVIKNRYGRNSIDIAYSGKWVASTHPSSIKHLILLGQLPMLLAKPAPEQVLVIGLGSGITSGSVLRHSSVKRVDIVEIEPAVLEGAAFFNAFSHDPVHDRRSRLILQDGRTHVLFGRESYDVITSDPIHPWVKGASNLYTREFYRGVRARLNQGGAYCQWIPSSMSPASFAVVVKTMRAVFSDVKLLFSGGEAIALASDVPVEFDKARLAEALSDPAVNAELKRYRMGTVSLLTSFLERSLRSVPSGDKLPGRINTDDNVLLEHLLPWDMFNGERAYGKEFPLVVSPKRAAQN